MYIMTTSRLILAMAFALTLGARSVAFAGEKGHNAPHWTYEGEGSPDKWGELSADYRICSQGKTQSPIDIKGAQAEELSPIDFSYSGIKTAKVLNNGHTLQVNYSNGSMISINGKEYDLVQFHFHAPSEHSIDGKLADMELHFVHKNGEKTRGRGRPHKERRGKRNHRETVGEPPGKSRRHDGCQNGLQRVRPSPR